MAAPTSLADHPVAVIGNVNLDIRTSPIPASERLFADGETSVAEIYETLGGGAANLAVAARDWAAPCICVRAWGRTNWAGGWSGRSGLSA